MVTVTIIFVIALLLTLLEGKGKLKNGMTYAFFMLIFLFSLRGAYGNDYLTYQKLFDNIINNRVGWFEVEMGWYALNRILGSLGFHAVLFVHISLVLLPLYVMIKRYVPARYRWLSMFLIVFNPSVFLLDLSMLRQSIAQSFFLLAVNSMILSKRIRSLVLLGCGFMFHYSCIICTPFIFLKDIFKVTKPYVVIMVLVLTLFIFSLNGELVMYIMSLVRENELFQEEYGSYTVIASEGGTGYGLLLQYLFFLPAFFQLKKFNNVDYLFIILYVVSFVFVPFGKYMTLYLRLSGYFAIFSIFLLPRLLSNCKDIIVKRVTYVIIYFYYLYSYYDFFHSATYGRYYMNFVFSFL